MGDIVDNLDRLRQILADIQCSIGSTEWTMAAGPMGNGFYVQLRYIEEDVETEDPLDQHGRKWYVSSWATPSEVVQTVLKAALTSAEHMVREHFRYRGERIYGPHFDVEALVDLARARKLDVRPPARRVRSAGGTGD